MTDLERLSAPVEDYIRKQIEAKREQNKMDFLRRKIVAAVLDLEDPDTMKILDSFVRGLLGKNG